MRNTIFQWLFYKIVRPLIKDGVGGKIEKQLPRMIAQIRLARLFGGARRVMIGDSNSAVFCNYEAMSDFNNLTLAFGVGGTTAHDWIEFFSTQSGKSILHYIRQCDIIWNIGGNYVLLGQMAHMPSGLAILRELFHNSWNCTCPPVRAGILEAISAAVGQIKTAESWQNDFDRVNKEIRHQWTPQCIDLYSVFNDPTQNEAYFFSLNDMVHYSRYAVKIIKSIVEAVA